MERKETIFFPENLLIQKKGNSCHQYGILKLFKVVSK